jgi:hypothetical protein
MAKDRQSGKSKARAVADKAARRDGPQAAAIG